ncbi:MAG: BCCT family transporter, partial [Polaromonas sp.]
MQDPNATPVPPPPPAAVPVSESAQPPRQPLTTLVPQVVVPALLVLGGLLVFCGMFPQRADLVFSGAQSWVVGHFDWFYTSAVTVFLIFLLMVAASRFGDIRLGPD